MLERTTARRCTLALVLATAALIAAPPADGGAQPAQGAFADVAAAVQRHMAGTWPQMDRIWPGADYRNRVVLLSEGRGDMWVMTPSSAPARTTAAALKRNKVSVPDRFDMVTWEGRQAIALNAGDDFFRRDRRMSLPESLFTAATHEMFHVYEQGSDDLERLWPSVRRQVTSQKRATAYPLDPKPRVYRGALYQALRTAFLNPADRQRQLGIARYWRDRWVKEYSAEAKQIAPYDILEGTARYAESMALTAAMGKAGAADRRSYLAGIYYAPIDGLLGKRDGESYLVGGLAGLLLDEQGRDWKRQTMTAGPTQLDILLDRVTPMPAEPAPDLVGELERKIEAKNKELAPTVDPAIAAYRDKRRALLLLRADAAPAYDPGEFLSTTRTPDLYAALTATYKLRTGRVKVNGVAAFTDTIGKTDYAVIPIDPRSARTRLTGSRLRLRSRGLIGTVTVTVKRDKSGRRLLVAT